MVNMEAIHSITTYVLRTWKHDRKCRFIFEKNVGNAVGDFGSGLIMALSDIKYA